MIGAGPAGCALALRLSDLDVVVLDGGGHRDAQIGESLPAASQPLLADLGVWEEFVADGHHRCFARSSAWGTPVPHVQDSLSDLDGPGWLLDRALFDRSLRTAAENAGVRVLTSARVSSAAFRDGGWSLRHRGSATEVRARVLVDASGRTSRSTAVAGVAAPAADPLICAWTHVPRTRSAQAITHIESAPDGWWYTAPLPHRRRVVAFHTDGDTARQLHLRTELLRIAVVTGSLPSILADSDTGSAEPVRFCAAGGAPPTASTEPTRLAVGDASMSFDPLSGQGLFHALYTGVTAAQTVRLILAGDPYAAISYGQELESVWRAYRHRLEASYAAERRYADHPFWQRRQARRP